LIVTSLSKYEGSGADGDEDWPDKRSSTRRLAYNGSNSASTIAMRPCRKSATANPPKAPYMRRTPPNIPREWEGMLKASEIAGTARMRTPANDCAATKRWIRESEAPVSLFGFDST